MSISRTYVLGWPRAVITKNWNRHHSGWQVRLTKPELIEATPVVLLVVSEKQSRYHRKCFWRIRKGTENGPNLAKGSCANMHDGQFKAYKALRKLQNEPTNQTTMDRSSPIRQV